jgi:putative membrane protein
MIALLADRDVAVSSLAGDWHVTVAPVVFVACALGLYARAFLGVRRRQREDAPARRAVLYAAGVAVVTVPLVSPLNAAAERYLLSAHMLEHVLLADAGPAMLVLAVRGPVARDLGRILPGARLLRRPALTIATWAAVIGVWHVPALYDGVLTHPWLHDLEHLSFVAVGLLVWVQMIDPAGTGRMGLAGRIAFTVAVFFAGQVLSDALVFSFRAYYPAYADQPARLAGISPLTDQRLAGIVMALEQLLTLGTCFTILLRRLRRSGEIRRNYRVA